jgi:hypothetical protein
MRDGYKPPFYFSTSKDLKINMAGLITIEELNKIILKYSYSCHTPLPEPFYQKEELKHNRGITYCAFIEVDGVKRILKKNHYSNYFIGLDCDFNEYTEKEILGSILKDVLNPVHYKDEEIFLEDELIFDSEAIQNLFYVLSPTANIALRRPNLMFHGDGWNYDAEHYWKESDVFESLFHLLKQYLKYEVANYEKYNPEWWLKGDGIKDKLFEEIVINKSADDLVDMLVKNGQWKQRDFDDEDWEMIKVLGLGDDIEKLILTFAMGQPGKEKIKNEI